MPIYEYECDDCREVLEVAQKIGEPPLEICPECRGRLRKIISRTTFHLKGDGWYVSEYKNKKNPNDKERKPDKWDKIEAERKLDGVEPKSYLDQNKDERK
ncbi:MAG: zinc ribbon domain-containing protein, partial [Deltaproteobacteria bacterium]|nr:zinc ribbon domain-containing protein [Deltaproteobacteria bacterium]